MKTLLLLCLTLYLLLPALPVLGDTLPMLPSAQPGQLPSIDTATIQPVQQEQNISATCYLGNPKDRNSLGDILVMSAEAAGPTCNSMFFNCRGACFGCFSDFDLSQDICVDNSGKKFLW
jgi:hypothetical protein